MCVCLYVSLRAFKPRAQLGWRSKGKGLDFGGEGVLLFFSFLLLSFFFGLYLFSHHSCLDY